MTPEGRKKWLYQEESRLTKYQHQHRGVSFRKLLLPPVKDRKVNIVGRDNHIYRGSIPRVREDELPPEVDETSIDEEALYKEIRDMNFPPVPEQEPLGPSRRVGGIYTLAKKLTLAPVQVDCTQGLEETLVLGRDGGLYKCKEKYPSKIELDKKLRGSKRPIQKVIRTSSTRAYVEPSLVLLQTSDKPPLYGKSKKSLIELPKSEIGNIMALIKEKDIKRKSKRITYAPDQKKATEHETEFQSEDDKASLKSKEVGMEYEAEKGETDSETPEVSIETDTEESTEAGESSGTEGTAETDEEFDIELEKSIIEAEESADTGETAEIAEESDIEAEKSSVVGETAETADKPDIEAGKSDTEAEKSTVVGETAETAHEPDIETGKSDIEAEKSQGAEESAETVEEPDIEK